MANKYCNLDGSKKIKDEYQKINIGFDKVEEDVNKINDDINALDERVDEIITTPVEDVSAEEIIDARGGRPVLGKRFEDIEDELDAHKAENVQQNECVFSNLLFLSNELPINPRKYDTNFGTVLTGKEIKESYNMSSGVDANASITKNDEVIYTPKFTSTNNIAERVSLELPSSLDLSDTSYFEFECFIDNLESFRVFQLRFYSEKPAAGVGYFQGQIHTTLKYTNKNGWRKIRIPKSYFTQVPSESPPDWSNITHVNIQIYSQPEQTVSVYIKSITQHNTIGTIFFDFDDTHDTIYDLAFPILENNQLVGNANITTGFIGDENRLTWEQVKKLYNAGWAICGHGHSHLDYTTLTEEQIRNDISLAQKNMREHGYKIGSLIHVANFGAWNPAVHDIAKQYCRVFRTLNSNNVNPFPPNSQHEFYYTADAKTVIENKSFIDKVIAKGGLGVLNFHSFYVGSGTGYNIDDFEEIVDYVKTKVDSGLLRVMNRYEVYLL